LIDQFNAEYEPALAAHRPRTGRIRRSAIRTGGSSTHTNSAGATGTWYDSWTQPVAPARGGIRELSRRHRQVDSNMSNPAAPAHGQVSCKTSCSVGYASVSLFGGNGDHVTAPVQQTIGTEGVQ